jgi:hypothetical protein
MNVFVRRVQGTPTRRAVIPTVPVAVRVFYGCRLALHGNKPWLAGTWADAERLESLEWRTKRDPNRINVCDDGYIVTFPGV